MTTIESKRVKVTAHAETIYTFLSNLNNFRVLLPESKISEWDASKTHCSFKVQGGYKIGLEWKEGREFCEIILTASEKSPFPFTLNVYLNEEDGVTEVCQICHADINAFLKMMVEKPLKNLFDHIADKLVLQF